MYRLLAEAEQGRAATAGAPQPVLPPASSGWSRGGLWGDIWLVIAVEEASSLPYLHGRELASRVQFASKVC